MKVFIKKMTFYLENDEENKNDFEGATITFTFIESKILFFLISMKNLKNWIWKSTAWCVDWRNYPGIKALESDITKRGQNLLFG